MRGEPLHLCTQDHTPIFFTGATCPYCTLRAEYKRLTQDLLDKQRAVVTVDQDARSAASQR